VKKLAVKFGSMTKAQRRQLCIDEDLQKSIEEFYKSDTVSRRAAIDRPISRELSASRNLVGDQSAHPVCDH